MLHVILHIVSHLLPPVALSPFLGAKGGMLVVLPDPLERSPLAARSPPALNPHALQTPKFVSQEFALGALYLFTEYSSAFGTGFLDAGSGPFQIHTGKAISIRSR